MDVVIITPIMLTSENIIAFRFSLNSNRREFCNISKGYYGNGYMHMQTNTTETIALQSVDYGTHYNLSNDNYFEVEFETNSDSQIDLITI